MSNLGHMTDQGFLPGAPEVGDIFKALQTPGGVRDLLKSGAGSNLQEAVETKQQQLKRDYARVYADPCGRRVIEDLMDQTLRRSFKPVQGFDTIEKTALYVAERTGQNGVVTYVLAMICQGQKAPDPAAQKSKKRK